MLWRGLVIANSKKVELEMGLINVQFHGESFEIHSCGRNHFRVCREMLKKMGTRRYKLASRAIFTPL